MLFLVWCGLVCACVACVHVCACARGVRIQGQWGLWVRLQERPGGLRVWSLEFGALRRNLDG